MRLHVVSVISSALLAASVGAHLKTWSTTADFNEGMFFNTNATKALDELQLNQTGRAPLPFINVPLGGRELANRGWRYIPGQLYRINTESGVIVGQYRLTPNVLESSPSRAVVDRFGNCWVTNR